jgi:hypothetical protein
LRPLQLKFSRISTPTNIAETVGSNSATGREKVPRTRDTEDRNGLTTDSEDLSEEEEDKEWKTTGPRAPQLRH